jgi:hypothetical protein
MANASKNDEVFGGTTFEENTADFSSEIFFIDNSRLKIQQQSNNKYGFRNETGHQGRSYLP